MKATLISIGNEVLSGKTLDTNSNFIANQLHEIGISVQKIYTISDEIDIIKDTLAIAVENSAIVFTTGGLGPTKDDRTKTAFAEFFKDELKFDESIFNHLRELFERRGRLEILDKNRNQAEVLSKATIFQNDHGTAPCQMIKEKNTLVFCLPGVPFEVKPLMKDKIIPYLKNTFALRAIVNKTVTIVGVPESLLSSQLEDWENALPNTIQLAYLPMGTSIKLRLTTSGNDKEKLKQILNDEVEKIKPIIDDFVISYDGENNIELLKSIVLKNQWTISTAESCTAGELARLLTSVSGSSKYFTGGVIPYDYRQKIKLLNVKEETIVKETVVSQPVAEEMAKGCQHLFNTNISIATTGVAGPSTDEFNNEVGTLHYAICINDEVYSNQFSLPHFEREDFVEYVTHKIIERLIQFLEPFKEVK